MRTHPIVEYYQALRDSAPCLSRAATLPKGTKLGLGKRRAPGNTIILSQPYRRRVSTDRLNREGSQLAASLEGEPGPTPAGKTLPHSFPETSRFRRERARDIVVGVDWRNLGTQARIIYKNVRSNLLLYSCTAISSVQGLQDAETIVLPDEWASSVFLMHCRNPLAARSVRYWRRL